MPEALADWRAEVEQGRELTAEAAPEDTGRLSGRAAAVFGSETVSLRWILVHLIEECACRSGHADLLRESIDGLTGVWRLPGGGPRGPGRGGRPGRRAAAVRRPRRR
ncbi:DUF664 domain-containing protein [Kitasatospora sp. NPDC094016]|uniref:mycothiol transferase n=1 Tax=Kitasatospora sp. NPDC094016 TaxID=3154986 RepID=UPI003333501D